MKICIMGKQILNRKSMKNTKNPQKGNIDQVALPSPWLSSKEMSLNQVESTEYNETSSLSSYIAEFETFAEEVKESIPEVDIRGRVNREILSSAAEGHSEELSTECSSQLSVRSEKQTSFIKQDCIKDNHSELTTLLSSRTPYDEFHHLFKNVPKDQFPINDFSCALSREILLQGRLYISQGWFCFYSNIFGWETQVTIDCRKIRSITREKTAYVVPNAILITTNDEKHFLSSFLSRETVYKLLIQVWEDILEKPQGSISNGVGSTVNREPSEESLLENLPFHDVIDDDDENDASNAQDVEPSGYDIESKLSADSGFFDGQPSAILVTELDPDKQKLIAFDKSLQEEIQCSPSKLPTCASIAVCIASIAEMLYSYFQVGFRLIRRLSKEQLFILVVTIMIMFLMCCSAFLLYRLSVLEPKVFAPRTSTNAYISHQSVQQILKLRKEVYDAEVLRVKKIVSANLDAISQIQDTLKMLQDDLMNQIQQNCTMVDKNVCLTL